MHFFQAERGTTTHFIVRFCRHIRYYQVFDSYVSETIFTRRLLHIAYFNWWLVFAFRDLIVDMISFENLHWDLKLSYILIRFKKGVLLTGQYLKLTALLDFRKRWSYLKRRTIIRLGNSGNFILLLIDEAGEIVGFSCDCFVFLNEVRLIVFFRLNSWNWLGPCRSVILYFFRTQQGRLRGAYLIL